MQSRFSQFNLWPVERFSAVDGAKAQIPVHGRIARRLRLSAEPSGGGVERPDAGVGECFNH